MNKKEAWDFAFGVVQMDGVEPSEELKKLAGLEIRGEITTEDIRNILKEKYARMGE